MTKPQAKLFIKHLRQDVKEKEDMIKVVERFVAGDTIEYYSQADNKWKVSKRPTFNGLLLWRIKP
jgi:uncharacterized UBP type Zn finger protein